MNSLVSIIIPAYNSAKYLPEAIESCFAQTYKSLQIIVVNDGSTDNTEEILKQYQDKIICVKQENKGLAGARNAGIKQATGEYFQFLDADDILLPEKIDKQVKFLENNTDYDVVYSDALFFHGNDKKNIVNKNLENFSGDILKNLLLTNFIPLHSTLFRNVCVNKAIGFNGRKGYLYGVEDWDFIIRVSYNGSRFAFMNEVLVLTRVHSDSMSASIIKMKRGGLDVMKEAGKYMSPQVKKKINYKKVLRWRLEDYAKILIKNGNVFKGLFFYIKAYL